MGIYVFPQMCYCQYHMQDFCICVWSHQTSDTRGRWGQCGSDCDWQWIQLQESMSWHVRFYPHSTWQLCAAHTINIMFKEVGSFPHIEVVVRGCKTISSFLYNHSTLHSKMHDTIRGELVWPNAIKFGTNFMLLQSLWDKQERFRMWITSSEWKCSTYNSDLDRGYTYNYLIPRALMWDFMVCNDS
jgi:hypothetical protein